MGQGVKRDRLLMRGRSRPGTSGCSVSNHHWIGVASGEQCENPGKNDTDCVFWIATVVTAEHVQRTIEACFNRGGDEIVHWSHKKCRREDLLSNSVWGWPWNSSDVQESCWLHDW